MTPKRLQKTIYNAAIICLLAAGLIYFFSRFVHAGVAYTDNAQVRQHITPVNTRVSGFIDRICFEEFQPVKQVYGWAAYACIGLLLLFLLYDAPARRALKPIPMWRTVRSDVARSLRRIVVRR